MHRRDWLTGLFLLSSLLATGHVLAQSTCYGTTAKGRLTGGVVLPAAGKNFVSYGDLPELAGRTYVHSTVKTIVVNAYKKLETLQPGKVFKYAETGFSKGGLFKPHKTHQNGLSVDFMMPVLNEQNQSVHLPTHPLNRYGYDIEFDQQGQYENVRIDFEALAAHLVALHKAAREQGVDLWRVILAPEFQPLVYKTRYGSYLKGHVHFNKGRSWVRHDEHYHVDFAVKCRTLN